MTGTDILAITVVLTTTLLIGALVGRSRLPPAIKWLIAVGLALRFGGAYARQATAADAHVYFRWGVQYAEKFSQLDLSPLFDPQLWRSASWIGTNAVGYPTGLIITLLGPSWFGTFFAFGLLSFLGLAGFALAYSRSFPGAPHVAYLSWILLLPSLWFWPSGIGKEGLMLLGLGAATLGWSGRNGRVNWTLMALGLALVFCIRPPVVAVYLMAVTLSYWLRFSDWSPRRVLQGGFMLVVGLSGIWFTMRTTLRAEVDLESVVRYVDTNAGRNDYGGSSIEGVGAEVTRLPSAVMNVLFRPFVWEVHNAAALASALELMLIWGLIWLRRRQLVASIRNWRRHHMLRFALPFTLLYVMALGMNLSNLGLLARQRVLVLPLLFMIVEGGAYYLREQAVQHDRERDRQPDQFARISELASSV